MRRFLIPVGACTLAVGFLVAPGTPTSAAPAATTPVSSQLPQDAKRIAKWDRMWFRGAGPVGGTDLVQPFSPPTAAEVKTTAPAANSIGVINIGWFVGTFPALPALPPFIPAPTPAIPNVNVPKDMQQGGLKAYVWYNTITGGDSPDGAAPFLGLIPVPGWNTLAGSNPPPDWIATDETGAYKTWSQARSKSPIMVAHRGGGEVGQTVSPTPENSLAAFAQAVKDGAGVLETDVQWTKPAPGQTLGTPVLMHDQTINRTAKCKPAAAGCVQPVYPGPTPEQGIKVSDLTKAQLDTYQLSNGESIPTLQAFLTLADKAKVGVLPEIKNWKTPASGMLPELEEYTDMLLAERAIPSVIIGSFDPTILQYFKDQATLVPQTASCAKLPKQLRANHTKVLLKKTCRTNAGKKVHVDLRAKDQVATLIKGKHGRVSVEVHDVKGKAKITFTSNDKPGFTTYKVKDRYRIKPVFLGKG